MDRFLLGHSGHADTAAALRDAAAQVLQQARSRGRTTPPTLGWCYFTDHHAPHAAALLQSLQREWPGVAWCGASGVGVAATGVEYFGTPGLVLMLAALPPERFRVFSGARPLGAFQAETALVHADPATPDLQELIADMAARVDSGYLFGGLASAREGSALLLADGVYEGGLSGVAFDRTVRLVSRVSQGSQPIGPLHTVTEVDGNVVLSLDGEPALKVLLADTGIDLERPQQAFARLRETLVGVNRADEQAMAATRAFGTDTRVRHLVGLDLGREAIAVGDELEVGMQLAFCRRHVDAARRDLVRICAEIREELEPQGAWAEPGANGAPAAGRGAETPAAPPPDPGEPIAGALYVSCAGRGGPHFGGPSAELQIVRHALGDVPLVGFFAAGEIARANLYGYTGVLTAFAA